MATYLGILSIIIGVLGYIPYLQGVWKKTYKPHALSWSVFALMTWLAFFAQVSEDRGPGVWVMALTATLCVFFAVVSFCGNWKKYVAFSDYLLIGASLVALILWLVTATPLYSVILITIADALAYIPIMRKAYKYPHTESLWGGVLAGLKFIPAILALNQISIITVLYPASLIITNFLYTGILLYKKKC